MSRFSMIPELGGMDGRYAVLYNELTDVWRILDLQHEAIVTISNLDDEIPDDHPAVTILPGLAVMALLDERNRLGIGKKSIETNKESSVENVVDEELYEEQSTEDLERYAIDAVVKIVGTRQVRKLGR